MSLRSFRLRNDARGSLYSGGRLIKRDHISFSNPWVQEHGEASASGGPKNGFFEVRRFHDRADLLAQLAPTSPESVCRRRLIATGGGRSCSPTG